MTLTAICKLAELKKQIVLSMYLARAFDHKGQKLIRQNKGGVFHLSSLGHEMLGSVFGHIFRDPQHKGFAYYRDRSFAIAKGSNLIDLFASLLARKSSKHCSTKQMPEHFCDPEIGLYCQSSVVGTQLLQACGAALGLKLGGSSGGKCYVSIGEGGSSQGDFHEALNFSCLHALPIVFVVQDNGWAISTASNNQTCSRSIADIANGYEGLNVKTVDGTDLDALLDVALDCRDRQGPSLVLAKVPRICAHSSSDEQSKYRDVDDIAQAQESDPFNCIACQETKERAFEIVEKASKEALELDTADESDDLSVFKRAQYSYAARVSNSEPIALVDALNEAMHEEMARDNKVIVYGQDVADPKGGVFGVTSGLSHKFSYKRCFNSPLAESTILGSATGLALVGYRPVVEIQFADYLWTGFNHLINEISSMYFRSNGLNCMPMVVRMPCGGYIQGGPYHSQSIEGILSHVPGLKIVIPSNSLDAKGLLKSAIREDNPVVFLEHKGLYRQQGFSQQSVGDADYTIPIGKARIVKEGARATVIGYGYMTYMVEALLHEEGIEDVEHIDLRTIVPLDREMIVASVKKTGKVLIVQEAPQTCGYGAEIAALIAKECFECLDAPIERVCGLDCPVPYSRELEERVLPSKERISQALKMLLAY